MNHSRIIQFADNAIKFNNPSPEILEAVDVHFAHCLGADKNVIAEYKIWVEKNETFSILRNGEDFQSNINFEQVLFQLMQDGLAQLNGAPTTHLIFHAAALAYQDHGLLLCGKSGSGKSTLTAQLVADGFQYLTDEVIALPVEGDQISGFCRSLVLKKGSAFIWRQLLAQTATDGLLEFKDGNAWVPPTLFNALAIRKEVRPRVLIFPTYKDGPPFQVESLTSANTLFHLMQTLVNARNFPDHGMAAAARLSRQVTAFSLTYSDIETATQWIQQTIAAE
jgi:hypothetical protein